MVHTRKRRRSPRDTTRRARSRDLARRAKRFAVLGSGGHLQLLRFAPGHGGWWWAYRRLPGFAPATERAYAVLAKRRGALAALTRLRRGISPYAVAARSDQLGFLERVGGDLRRSLCVTHGAGSGARWPVGHPPSRRAET